MRTRTKYLQSVIPPSEKTSMLKPGGANKKLGDVVLKGPLLGAQLFQLSLEERKTCPVSCLMWDNCYGDNMPFAHRFDHTDPQFYSKLEAELWDICAKHRLVLIRLHVLGDFFSQDYVAFWARMLRLFPHLHVFGYTAHPPCSAVGSAVDDVSSEHGWLKFAVRFSGAPMAERAALVEDQHASVDSFWCPEQTKQAESCAACAACWDGKKTVRFREH